MSQPHDPAFFHILTGYFLFGVNYFTLYSAGAGIYILALSRRYFTTEQRPQPWDASIALLSPMMGWAYVCLVYHLEQKPRPGHLDSGQALPGPPGAGSGEGQGAHFCLLNLSYVPSTLRQLDF